MAVLHAIDAVATVRIVVSVQTDVIEIDGGRLTLLLLLAAKASGLESLILLASLANLRGATLTTHVLTKR